MKAIQIWFIFESIHFLLGSIGCIFFPRIVINSYSLMKDPTTDMIKQSTEFIYVMSGFYISFLLSSIISSIYHTYAEFFSICLFSMYFTLFINDIISMYKVGYSNNKNRYIDTAIHVIFGIINLIMFIEYN